MKGGVSYHDDKRMKIELKLIFINNIFAVAKMIHQKFGPFPLIFMTFEKFCGIYVFQLCP